MLTIPIEIENETLGDVIIHLNIDQIIFWCEEYNTDNLGNRHASLLIEVTSGEAFRVKENAFGYKKLINYLKDNDVSYQEEPLCQ